MWSSPSSSSPRPGSSRRRARRAACAARAQLPLGIVAPGSTTATVAPAPKFQAPQTIERARRRRRRRGSAGACRRSDASRPRARGRRRSGSRFPPAGTPRRTMRSTSQLVNTSRRASSSTGRSKATYSRSQQTGTFIRMPQHAQVVLPERAQVGEAVPEHGDALDPEAEGEALTTRPGRSPRCGTRPGRPSRRRPSRSSRSACRRAALAAADEAGDVELDRRLGEREEARPHPHLALGAEQRRKNCSTVPFRSASVIPRSTRGTRPGGRSASGSRRACPGDSSGRARSCRAAASARASRGSGRATCACAGARVVRRGRRCR